MGACEPEATLDRGWFNWAASRAMLVRTYDQEGNEIQTTSTYAPTKTLTVRVTDHEGNPVSGATVDFRLYNYSEFYPLHTAVTDDQGNAQFTTSYGDLQVCKLVFIQNCLLSNFFNDHVFFYKTKERNF